MPDDYHKGSTVRHGVRAASSHKDMPPLSSRKDLAKQERKRRGLPSTYVRLSQLGKGGFARVYEMLDRVTNKKVAVKVVQKSHVKKANAEAKLRSEIQIHKSLEHSTIVRFMKSYEDEENAYIILELCPNLTLSEYLRSRPGRVISNPEAVYFAKDLLAGLFYLRENMVIHRDLKLSNLFLDANMHLKIGDFGLAAQLEDSHDVRHTLCGTPNYIAPEVLNVKAGHSFEVDLWGFGVIVYTLLVGRPPFETENLRATYRKIRKMEYSFPDTVSPDAKEMIVGVLQANVNVRWTLDDILHCAWINQPSVHPSAPGSLFPVARPDPHRGSGRPASAEPRTARGHETARQRTATADPHRVTHTVTAPRVVPPARTQKAASPSPCATGRGRLAPQPSSRTPRVSSRNGTKTRSNTPVRSKSRDVSPNAEWRQESPHVHKDPPPKRVLGCGALLAEKTEARVLRPATRGSQREREMFAGQVPKVGDDDSQYGFLTRVSSATRDIVRSLAQNSDQPMEEIVSARQRIASSRPAHKFAPPSRQATSPKGASTQFTHPSSSSSSQVSHNRLCGMTQKRRDISTSRATTARTDISRTDVSPSPSATRLTYCIPQDDTLPQHVGSQQESDPSRSLESQHGTLHARQKSDGSLRSLRQTEIICNVMGAKQTSDGSLRSWQQTGAPTPPTLGAGRRGPLAVTVLPLHIHKISGDLRTMGPDVRTSDAAQGMETVRVRHQSAHSRTPTTVVTPVTRACSSTSQAKPATKDYVAASGKASERRRSRTPSSSTCPRPTTPTARARATTPTSRSRSRSMTPPSRPTTPPSRPITPPARLRATLPTARPPPSPTEAAKSAVARCRRTTSLDRKAKPTPTPTQPHTQSLTRLTPSTAPRFTISLTDSPEQSGAVSVARVCPQVVRWVDYTSKYGIGTLMSDYSINVRFNDMAQIIASSADGATEFHYISRARRSPEVRSVYRFSSFPKELKKKVTLFAYFRSTLLAPIPLDGFGLSGQSCLPICHDTACVSAKTPRDCPTPQKAHRRDSNNEDLPMPFVDKWHRNGQAVSFRLNNNSFQVVFFDKTELLLDNSRKILRYMNKRKKYRTYRFDEYKEYPELEKRVLYAKSLVAKFVD